MSANERLKRQLCAAAVNVKPRVPDAGRLVWDTFVALHNARTVTMAGPQAITHEAIQAFTVTQAMPLRPDHVRILRAMDDAWLKKARAGDDHSPPGTAPTATQDITPALFDAVFG